MSFPFFWHPWHPWGRLSSGGICVLRIVLNILLQWRRLADFFIFIKMISHVSFIVLVPKIMILSLDIPRKLTIIKIHHLIRLRFERSEHKKVPVWLVQPSKMHCSIKIIFVLCADEYLGRLEGKIGMCLFFYVKLSNITVWDDSSKSKASSV